MAAREESETFERRFLDSVGKPIDFEGEPVHAIYRRELEPGTLIEVELVRARQQPEQGLELRIDDGLLRWREAEKRGRSFQLWAGELREASMELVTRAPTRLHVWNVWREGEADDAAVEAWKAWSGMRIEEVSGGVALRCSGNAEAADFGDLIVRLTFRGA